MVKPLLLAGAAAGSIAAAALATTVLGQPPSSQPPPATTAQGPASQQSLIERGRYLTTAGDCVACHTKAGGQPFAGGRPLQTPFGTILSANITPGGIGDWTPDQFYRALHEGVDDEGHHLYPAFPYNYYTKVSRADSDAILAYLKSLPAVQAHWNRNQLPFPFNIRAVMIVWNALFLHKGEFRPDASKSAEWNRGAYLVQGLGHCGACHTPMNFLGAPKGGQDYRGGRLGISVAPDLTPNRRTGLGGWTADEVVEFLKSGRNAHASSSAEMGEVVAFSTSHLSDADLHAIAIYLGAQPASPAVAVSAPDPATMRQGEAIFVDSCSACHRMDGSGVPRFFPPLRGDANLQQRDPAMTLRFILAGTRSTPTDTRPTPLSMPAYDWKLSDAQVAAVATYVRNAWGDSAPGVSEGDVGKLRRKLPAVAAPAPPHATRPTPSTLGAAGTDSRDNGGPNAGRAAPANDGIGGTGAGGAGGAAGGGADSGHPGGVATGGPG